MMLKISPQTGSDKEENKNSTDMTFLLFFAQSGTNKNFSYVKHTRLRELSLSCESLFSYDCKTGFNMQSTNEREKEKP